MFSVTLLDDVLSEAAGEASAVWLDIDLSYGPVFHQHCESLAPGDFNSQPWAQNSCYTWHCPTLRSDPVQAQELWSDLHMYQLTFLPIIMA